METGVFERRAFQDPWGVVDNSKSAEAFLRQLPQVSTEMEPDRADIIADHLEWARPRLIALASFRRTEDLASRLEALRQVYGFEGTHSIIDIGVEDLWEVPMGERIRRFGEAVPELTQPQLMDLLPLVEEQGGALWLRYVDNRGKAMVGFVGISGD